MCKFVIIEEKPEPFQDHYSFIYDMTNKPTKYRNPSPLWCQNILHKWFGSVSRKAKRWTQPKPQ